MGQFLPRFQVRAGREDDSVEEIFGNDRRTYCANRECDGSCGVEVHVIRMQDGPRAVTPRVLVFDLI